MLSLVRPRYFVPIHGEYRQLSQHARVAARGHRRTARAAAGPARRERRRPALRRRRRRASPTRRPAGRVLIDGTRTGEVGDEVLRDRRHLAEDGLVVPVVAINKQTGALEGRARDHHARLRHGRPSTATLLADGAALLVASSSSERQRRGAHRPGADARKAARRAAPLPSASVRAGGRSCCPSSWRSERARDAAIRFALSRRVSEFVGVALFALALIWLIALASYEPTDPVWFFSTGAHAAPANFAGRVGAFLAELSFQLFGYASYLIPAHARRRRLALLLVPDARRGRTRRSTGAALLFACAQRVPQPRVRHASTSPARPFRAGGYVGEWLGGVLSEYLNRTGSVIVILTLIVAGGHPVDAVLVRPALRARSSQAARAAPRGLRTRSASGARSAAREAAPRGASPSTRKKDAPRRREGRRAPRPAPADAGAAARGRRRRGRRRPLRRRPARAAARAAGRRRRRRRRAAAAAARSGADRRRRPNAARARTRCRRSSLLDAPKTERKIDERELMDGGAPARGEVPRVLRRGHGRPDPPGPGRHDLRVQAGRRREVQQDHRPRRRPVPRDAGRVGADRSHPRQVDRRHPDSRTRTASRSRCASCSSRTPTRARRRS